jgi:Glycosyl hydrolases family 39/Bacterial Ig domain
MLGLCLAALAAVPAAAGATAPGVVLPNPGGADTQAKIIASGAKNVRVFASWRALEQQQGQFTPYIISGYDDLATAMKAAGIPLYFVVVQTPAWAGEANSPPPVAAYADFMRRLAEHFKGRVEGYEIWNEPNEGIFWKGSASPAAYTTLLKASHDAIKGADPAAKVGVGGLIGNDYNYVDDLYKAGAKGNFDFLGLHTDGACNRTDPREAARDVDGRISRWSFTGYREVHATMVDHGDDSPIWMTEVGWSVTGTKCPASPKEPAGVTREQQALFLTHAYACLAADPYVENASWFSLQDFSAMDSLGFRYGLYDYNGSPRPSLSAFQRAASLAPDRSCGLDIDRDSAGISIAWPTNNKNVSGDLRYSVSASDAQGIRNLTLFVDGKQVRRSAKTSMKGLWVGWRKLSYGPHTVTVKAVDKALNVSTSQVTVNRVGYGDGEDVRTRIAVGVYGTGKKRLVAGTLFTKPAVARSNVRGRLQISFERKAGKRWVPTGAAAAGSVRKAVKVNRKFKPGKYRAVLSFAGYKSFRPVNVVRPFKVK